jgi:hypothetical protein
MNNSLDISLEKSTSRNNWKQLGEYICHCCQCFTAFLVPLKELRRQLEMQILATRENSDTVARASAVNLTERNERKSHRRTHQHSTLCVVRLHQPDGRSRTVNLDDLITTIVLFTIDGRSTQLKTWKPLYGLLSFMHGCSGVSRS